MLVEPEYMRSARNIFGCWHRKLVAIPLSEGGDCAFYLALIRHLKSIVKGFNKNLNVFEKIKREWESKWPKLKISVNGKWGFLSVEIVSFIDIF